MENQLENTVEQAKETEFHPRCLTALPLDIEELIKLFQQGAN